MNWVDVAILVGLGWFTYAAFNAGLIREVVTIIGAIFAVALAGLLYTNLAKDIDVGIDNIQTSRIIAFAVIFGAVILASQLIAMFLKAAASILFLGIFDSLGGAIFGFVKGLILAEIALIYGITFTTLGVKDAIERSTLAPFFLRAVPILKQILPAEFKNAIDAF